MINNFEFLEISVLSNIITKQLTFEKYTRYKWFTKSFPDLKTYFPDFHVLLGLWELRS